MIFLNMSVLSTNNSDQAEEMVPIDVYDEKGNKIQLMVSREFREKIKQVQEFKGDGPVVWKSEQEREDAMSWRSDNEEEDMIKAGCRKRKDD